MYTFFRSYEGPGAPSFAKFAQSIGVTLENLLEYKRHSEFERAYRECSEIRRDYLIDNGLSRRFDASFTKFVLSEEASASPDSVGLDGNINVTIEVVGEVTEGKNEAKA